MCYLAQASTLPRNDASSWGKYSLPHTDQYFFLRITWPEVLCVCCQEDMTYVWLVILVKMSELRTKLAPFMTSLLI